MSHNASNVEMFGAFLEDHELLLQQMIFNVPVIILNIVQIWCLRKKFRRQVNPLTVLLFNISLCDLTHAIISTLNYIKFLLFHNTLSEIVTQVLDLLVYGGLQAAWMTSVCTMVALALLKTDNKRHTKTFLKNFCQIAWFVNLLIFGGENILFKAGVYSGSGVRYRGMVMPVATFGTGCVLLYCVAGMCRKQRGPTPSVVRRENANQKYGPQILNHQEFAKQKHNHQKCEQQQQQQRQIRRQKQHHNIFAQITMIYLIIFTLCTTPVSTYKTIIITSPDTYPNQQLTHILITLTHLTPLLDVLGFFVVFRKICFSGCHNRRESMWVDGLANEGHIRRGPRVSSIRLQNIVQDDSNREEE